MYSQTKICSKCREELGGDQFGLNSRSKDKLKAWCKNCSTIYMRQFRAINDDKMGDREREYGREYYVKKIKALKAAIPKNDEAEDEK